VTPSGATGRASLPGFLLFAALLLLAAHALLFIDYTVDDAYISWRYARSIAEGAGPVYDPGERIEGFSNPLYTLLLVPAARLLPGDNLLPLAARALGFLAALGTLLLMARWPRVDGPGGATALLLTATSTSFALWAVGGLETPLYALALAAAFLATVSRPERTRGFVTTGLLLAAVALSRPEGIVPAGALLLVRLLDPATRRHRKGHVVVAVAFALPVVAYLAFRLAYYGDWVPNTYYAKKLALDEAWRRGSWYLVSFVHHNGGKWLYAAAPLAFLDRERRPLALVAALLLAAYLPYVVWAGGDWMDQHRFVAPVVPFVYLLVGLGWGVVIDGAARLLARWPGGFAATSVRALGVLVVWLLLLRPTIELTRRQIDDGGYVNAAPYYVRMGRLVGHLADRDWTTATHDIGAVGWYGRTRVVDLLGLVDADLAKGRVDGDALLARERPDLVLLHYDNRPDRSARWRTPDVPGFDSLYAAPRSAVAVPGALRVRRDRLSVVERRLSTVPASMRADLDDLSRWLETHEPDGRALSPRPR
jgi:arabinofuranosyltransferase